MLAVILDTLPSTNSRRENLSPRRGLTIYHRCELDAIVYCKEHPDLTLTECAKKLGIGTSTLSKWKILFRENEGYIPIVGSSHYQSEEQKEIARLKRDLRDAQDALSWQESCRRSLPSGCLLTATLSCTAYRLLSIDTTNR